MRSSARERVSGAGRVVSPLFAARARSRAGLHRDARDAGVCARARRAAGGRAEGVDVSAGSFAAIAGICRAAQEPQGDPETGLGYELDAIARVVTGGTRLAGGYGGADSAYPSRPGPGLIQRLASARNVARPAPRRRSRWPSTRSPTSRSRGAHPRHADVRQGEPGERGHRGGVTPGLGGSGHGYRD